MAALHSVDTRDALAKAVDSSMLRGRGLTVDQATDVLHGLLLVSGAGAAVVAVLAVFLVLGNVGARVVLTVLAVVVILGSAAMDTGAADLTLPPMSFGLVLAFAIGLLWSRPARDWYAGRPLEHATALSSAEPPDVPGQGEYPPPPDQPDRPAPDHQAPDRPAPGQPSPTGPRPTYGYGSPQAGPEPPDPTPPPGYPPPGHAPYPPYGPPPGYPPQQAYQPQGVPGPVRTAAILTWVFAGVALAGFVVVGIVLAADRGDLFDELERRQEYQDLDVTRDQVTVVLIVLLVVLAFWAVCECVLAFLVWRGQNWARITLAVSAGMTAVVSLAMVPVSLLHLVVGAVVVGLLFSPASNQWFRSRSVGRMPAPPYPPAGPPPGQPPRDDSPSGPPKPW
jgi:hypothetical protein